jgi:uncharacterized membrane protein
MLPAGAICRVAAIAWQPQLNAFGCGLVVALCGAYAVWLFRRLCRRFSRRKAALVLAPKALLLLLLIAAVFNPTRRHTRPRDRQTRVLVLTDVSGSMSILDAPDANRARRAAALQAAIEEALPAHAAAETLFFDTKLHTREDIAERTHSAPGGTDLGGSLLELTRTRDLSSYAAAVVLTDGGDEPVQAAVLPPVPVHIVGIGARRAETWTDVAVSAVDAPPSVEHGTEFEVRADLTAHGPDAFLRGLGNVDVTLEHETPEGWVPVAGEPVDLARGRARATFRLQPDQEGAQAYRVSVPALPGEGTTLNNQRPFTLDVRKQSLNVLFFTRELGASLKLIRGELAKDPGVTFTALFRTIGERFTVQGEDLPGSENLEAGFPADAKVLGGFDVIILGAFPAEEWRADQVAALVAYVEQGGGLVFLGGREAFGRGGYAATPLAPLFPWALTPAEPEMLDGRFQVSVPLSVSDHPVVAGLSALMAEHGALTPAESGAAQAATIDSVNLPGRLKPGAVALLHVSVQGRPHALVATQPFGRGRVIAIASNTLWKWGRESAQLRDAFGRFWRQAVRNLSSGTEGGTLLAVSWDRGTYRPGERATARINAATRSGEPPPQLRAVLRRLGADAPSTADTVLPVVPVAGAADAFEAQVTFADRGTYQFALTATRGDTVLETYTRTLPVSPRLAEGNRPEVDESFLASLAGQMDGMYVHESGLDALLPTLRRQTEPLSLAVRESLIFGNWHFVALCLLVMAMEWALRRRANLF